MNESNIENGRAMSNLRIQKKEDYKTIASSDKYKERVRESSMFRRIMMKGLNKKVGIISNIVADSLDGPNKGYPEGFKDYKTYDKKRNN